MSVLLSVQNWVDGSNDSGSATVITAEGTASDDLAPENVQDPSPQTPWRSDSGSSGLTRWIQSNFGSSWSANNLEIGVIAGQWRRDGPIPYSGSGSTVALALDTLTPGGTNALNVADASSSIDRYTGSFFHKPASGVLGQYLRVSITQALSAYVELGRLWAGPAIVPAQGVLTAPLQRSWADLGRLQRSPRSGVLRRDLGPRPREVAFQLEGLSSSDADDLYDTLERIAGTTRQVLFCWDTSAPAKTTILGAVTEIDPLSATNFALDRKAFKITEDL